MTLDLRTTTGPPTPSRGSPARRPRPWPSSWPNGPTCSPDRHDLRLLALSGSLQAVEGDAHVRFVGADPVGDAGDELDHRPPVEQGDRPQVAPLLGDDGAAAGDRLEPVPPIGHGEAEEGDRPRQLAAG